MPQASFTTDSRSASDPAACAPFVCSWKAGGRGGVWVHVEGELDLASSPVLKRALREAQVDARLVVLDLRKLTFIDGSGIHAILDAAREAARGGHRLMLVRGPTRVDRVFTLTGASAEVSIFDLDPAEPARALDLD